ncbi:MAG: hydantoinase/oxoprolinase family protein [Candidatus Hermodarchaeota archaeon]
MTIIVGLDIGGANTKAALLLFKDDTINESYSYIEYFPFWEKTIKDIPEMLIRVFENLFKLTNFNLEMIDNIAVTITAELSDAFKTKREGVLLILEALRKIIDKEKLSFITNTSQFINYETAKSNYYLIAGANWASTALFLGAFKPTCILIDAGSTTIDFIPILNSIAVPEGKDDVSRLVNHELVYTGGLRATIPSITHHVPYKGNKVRVSFEKFALISDVHRILNNISEAEYINDTADNRSKSIEDCYARLSRIICTDIETISKEKLDLIANFIYQKQLDIITREIGAFMKNLTIRFKEFADNPQFVTTGLSADFLIMKPLRDLGYTNIINFEELTNISDNISSSAFAVAGALYNQLNNKNLRK